MYWLRFLPNLNALLDMEILLDLILFDFTFKVTLSHMHLLFEYLFLVNMIALPPPHECNLQARPLLAFLDNVWISCTHFKSDSLLFPLLKAILHSAHDEPLTPLHEHTLTLKTQHFSQLLVFDIDLVMVVCLLRMFLLQLGDQRNLRFLCQPTQMQRMLSRQFQP